MAITRTQIAKQLLANGGRIALKGGADASGRDVDVSPTGDVSASGRNGNTDGRDPMAQFGKTKVERDIIEAIGKREMAKRNQKIGFGEKINFPNFFPTVKTALNFFEVPVGNRFAAGFNKSLRDLNEEDEDTGNGDGQQIILPPVVAQAPSIVEQEPEIEEEKPFEFYRRYRADGGIMNTDVVGGEIDFESARQMYGLGKLVKKVTRSVKKIAKSPIGKAALLYTGAAGIGALGAGTGFTGFKANFMSPTTLFGSLKKTGQNLGLLKRLTNTADGIGMGLPQRIGPLANLGIGSAIMGTSLIAGALTAQQEEEAQQISDETGIDIAEIRANPNKYLARRFRAEGGSMDEPVAKKTMPLLDMGGKEMDLRAEGGFVPIGRMEKADDVPARLSKNEFVFTADAVRNAGDGSVDKGAEVMYNMMKNLESGGDVSEESQGLEGARKMFQTSQRLEEVL